MALGSSRATPSRVERAGARALFPRGGDGSVVVDGGGPKAKAVLRRCAAHEPNRGEIWLRYSKRRDLRKQSPAEVLAIVVEGLAP